jgi:signal transduction histidine kinase
MGVMRFRNSRVRTKVTALLLSLAALWSFAAWVTLRDGLNLLWVSTLDQSVGRPTVALVAELQEERRLTSVYLGGPGRQQREALKAQRSRTDEVRARFQEQAGGEGARLAAGDALEQRIGETLGRLERLDADRGAVDAGRVDRARAAAAYSAIIDAAFRVYRANATLDDEGIAKDGRTLIELIRAQEILAREDALLAGVLATGRLTEAEYAQFVQLVGAQRHIHTEAAAELPEPDRARYEELAAGPAMTRLRTLEDLIIRSGPAVGTPPVSAQEWRAAVEPLIPELERLVLTAGDSLVERATPVAVGVVARLLLAGGLGLLAVIASVVLSITTARALVGQLEKLREAARELAEQRLPSVVERLGRGEKVDVRAEAPPLAFGNDAIGQVGQAFNVVQETAVRVAVQQAELRQSIRDILLSLARRTQSLVHRQLTLLDTMERRENDPDELRDLFRVDHLATRMRRNAENLIIMSGASPGRAWRRPVPMVDVVRGALAEVEDYTRVTVMPMGQVELVGRAVGDVIHLLAELIENAVSFSPPYTTVQVSGQLVANGYVIEVEDRGLGMSQEDIDAANRRIADPPEFNLATTSRLGLFVVSRLAERHTIRVALKPSPYGGTTAVILLPHELVSEEGDDGQADGPADHGATAFATDRAVPGQGGPKAAMLDEWRPVPNQDPRPVLTAVGDVPPEPAGDLPVRGRPADVWDDAPAARPAAPEQVAEPPAEEEFTPSGLPLRVPQASIAPALRTDGPFALEGEDDGDDRSPEEIRKIMGAFQTGTRRGRSDAAKLLGAPHQEPDPGGPAAGGGP